MQQRCSVAECRSCGHVQTVPLTVEPTKQDVISRAWQLFRNRELNQAATLFELAASLCPQEPEGYWGRVLCRYGAVYTAQGIVCERDVPTGIAEDPDMAKVMEYADPDARRRYAREANQIERQRIARLQSRNTASAAQLKPVQKKQGKKRIWIACTAAVLIIALALVSVFVLLPMFKDDAQQSGGEQNLYTGLPYVPNTAPDDVTNTAPVDGDWFGSEENDEPPVFLKKGTIAVIAKGETHAYWQAVKAGAIDAGKAAGYDITFRGPTAESEEYAGSQRDMVQDALNNPDTKALVLATIGLGFADELIYAYENGIPVVEVDSGLYDGGADITEGKDPTIGGVATDNFVSAGVVAENFYAYLKDNGLAVDGYKVGVIQHESTSTGIDRAGGFKAKIEELAAADGITLDINVQVKANNAGEYKLGLLALVDWGAQAIFMTNEGVVNEVFPEISDNAAAYQDILFCGFDAGTNQYNWMKDNGANYALLVGSVAQDSYSMGRKAVELAVARLNGEDVCDVGIAGVWYTTENIDELREKNIFYFG